MQHDIRMREAARAIYNAVYPGDEWSPVTFEEAEQHQSVHYRNAVAAAQGVRLHFLSDTTVQLALL
ncbi:hypothetical protein [Sphingobium boeckii]|uniref:Uncharacterized protein n=1 Tax=Sphingobium boeckii TaxID=1082345 RepID=A0A7W9AGB5_9SPHN|nr:hypothetical protein [Sphingobium boeckii]MBB5685002.1 hypothetical protein [Sphingobium boeckii]